MCDCLNTVWLSPLFIHTHTHTLSLYLSLSLSLSLYISLSLSLSLSLLPPSLSLPPPPTNKFKAKYHKVYASAEEEAARERAFETSVRLVRRHNHAFEQGLTSYRMAINAFADVLPAAPSAGHDSSSSSSSSGPAPLRLRSPDNTGLAIGQHVNKSVDWRTHGDVSPVRNQGQCGAPWAFAAVEAVESMNAIATGTLTILSLQQVIDCSSPYGTQGCNGGTTGDAFAYIVANGGLDSAADYPTTGTAEPCDKEKEKHIVAKVAGYKHVPPNNETLLEAAVFQRPVAAAIDASSSSFLMYSGGVYDGPCGTQLDHAVVVVGYTPEYWIVKNSWGSSWGENGYIFMKRGVSAPHGICGIAMAASYPTPPSPAPQRL